jgi:hypothetical protein
MVLNSKRFRGRRDTPFYGVGFGLGFGALNVLFLVGNAVVHLAARPGPVLVEALSLGILGLYFIGSILLHASVGAWIGRGAASHKLAKPVLMSAAAEAVYLVGSYLLFTEQWGNWVPAVAIVATIALIAYVIRTELDPIVPPEIRREMEIHQRRIARQAMRGPTEASGTDPDAARTPPPKDEATPPPGPGSS